MFKVFLILLAQLPWGFQCSFRLMLLWNLVLIYCRGACIRIRLYQCIRFVSTHALLGLCRVHSSCLSFIDVGISWRFSLGGCPLWNRIIRYWDWKCQDVQTSSNASPFTKDRSLRIDVLLLCSDQSSFWLQVALRLKANLSKFTISILI